MAGALAGCLAVLRRWGPPASADVGHGERGVCGGGGYRHPGDGGPAVGHCRTRHASCMVLHAAPPVTLQVEAKRTWASGASARCWGAASCPRSRSRGGPGPGLGAPEVGRARAVLHVLEEHFVDVVAGVGVPAGFRAGQGRAGQACGHVDGGQRGQGLTGNVRDAPQWAPRVWHMSPAAQGTCSPRTHTACR